MKKVYLLLMLCCLTAAAWAQQPVSGQPNASKLTPAQLQQLQALKPSYGNRALIGIALDYDYMDEVVFLANGGNYSRYIWRLHSQLPEVTNFNNTTRWIATVFDTLIDANTGNVYSNVPYKLDSLEVYYTHARNGSIRNDTVRIIVYAAAGTAGILVDAQDNITNTVLWDTLIITNTNLTANAQTLGVFRVRPNINFTAGQDFVSSVQFRGDTTSRFNVLAGYGEYCNDACGAFTAVVPDNSVYYMNFISSGGSNFSGINPLYLDCNANTSLDVNNCELYYIQNWAITPYVTVNTGSSSACPDQATGTPGFRPDYNNLACINQSTAYNSQVSFEVPSSITSPLPATINNIKIDSIRNLPCGITYTLDRGNATYNGGEVGCITFSGTTTVPVGAYRLQVFATANTSFGTLPSSDISALGFEYYLRVIANGATVCPTVASGSAGLTANCSTTPTLTAAPTASNPTICRGNSTTLSANASGGTAPYSYSWSASTGAAPAATANPSVSPTVTTTYTVTVTATGGATATGSVTVTVNVPPSATISGATSICSGGSTTLSAPAGLSYNWSNGSTNQSITVSSAGTYSVTTTQNGCTATSSVSVTVGNPTATITPSGPTSFCTGGSVTLSAPAGFTYVWSANAGSSTNQSVNVTTSGTYSVTVSAGAGCTATSSMVVTVSTAPSATITPNGPTTFCSGGSVTLSAPAGFTYLWSSNAGSATGQTVNVTQSGTYSVTVSNNGCTATNSIAVTVTSSPSATITPSGPTTFCIGGSVTLNAPAGLSYNWSNGTTNQSITVNQNGTYSVTVSNGTCTATSSVTVSAVSSPNATITPNGPTTFCSGGNVILSAPAGYNYTWSSNAGNATTQTVTVNQSGTYNVTVSAGASCTATSSIMVTVNTPPTVSISPSGPTTFCTGGSVTLTASSGASYLWSNGSTQSSINATQSGTYIVTVTSANTCSNTAQIVVTVVSTPSATITPSGPTTICPGNSVTLSAPAGYTYQWSNGSTTESITATLPGTYSVTVSAGASCTATSSVTVSQHSAPSALVTPAGPVTICTGATVTLSAPAGLQYQWSTGATTQTITPTLAGTYDVTVTNANNCSAVSAPVVVTAANPPATPVVTNNNNVLSSTAASGYQWYNNGSIINGANSQTYTPTQNGNYTVVITDANGCSSQSAPVQVVISSIADIMNNLTVKVQPNPSTGIFYISSANLSGTSNLVVLDIAGREVLNQIVEGQLQQYPLDLGTLGDGVYILRLSNGNAVNHTRLIVY